MAIAESEFGSQTRNYNLKFHELNQGKPRIGQRLKSGMHVFKRKFQIPTKLMVNKSKKQDSLSYNLDYLKAR